MSCSYNFPSASCNQIDTLTLMPDSCSSSHLFMYFEFQLCLFLSLHLSSHVQVVACDLDYLIVVSWGPDSLLVAGESFHNLVKHMKRSLELCCDEC